jgi:diguanylate cyclase (GGDEF)-like protein
LDGKTSYFECEHRIRQADGSYRWVLSHGRTVLGPNGEPERLAGSQTDIKRMKNFEAQLVHEATHDRLTGLANRQHLLEALEETFQKNLRAGTGLFAVAFMDLDRFKSVNDTLGHHVGDELLRLVAQRIQKAIRDQDLAVRLGGDEFVVLMRSVHNLEDAMEVAQRIRDLMTEKLVIGSHEILTAASIGVALSSPETTNGSEIMRNADIAMYQAKSSGRGQVLAFDSEMGRVMSRSFSLQSDMAKAIENDEFELHYQPLVNPTDGKIMGAEALIRWRRASDELVYPAEFIGLAEESGMIVQIGQWVFTRACRQLNEWLAEGLDPIKISINFSARELADLGTSDVVARVLKESRIDPKWLQVEITESDLVDGRLSTVESLDRLNRLGIATAIDDFGTGYSALSYLRKLTCRVLKIDQSFVHDIETDPKASALARSIINMAHNLQLGVVAEGVESKEQLAILRGFGCDLIQGYLASRPIPADEFKELLRTGCAEAIGIETPPAGKKGRGARKRRGRH